MHVMQVKKEWHESEATSTLRMRGQLWSRPWLALDGSDADPDGLLCQPVTIHTYRYYRCSIYLILFSCLHFMTYACYSCNFFLL